jgi:hypothetical protein
MRRMWLKRFGLRAGPERAGRALPYLADLTISRRGVRPAAVSRFLLLNVRTSSEGYC